MKKNRGRKKKNLRKGENLPDAAWFAILSFLLVFWVSVVAFVAVSVDWKDLLF